MNAGGQRREVYRCGQSGFYAHSKFQLLVDRISASAVEYHSLAEVTLEAPGLLLVFAAGGGVAAGVVVEGQGRGGAVAQGLPEELPGADEGGRSGALAEDALRQ